MATLQMKIDSVHAEFLSGNAVSTTVTDNSVVSRDSNGGIWATKLTSLNLGLTHGIPTTDRTGDTIFYSSDDDIVRKNTAAGMRASLGLANSATITADSGNTGSAIVVRDASGDFSAGKIDANGSALSDLNASNLTSGTVNSARLSLTASDIPNLNASKITAGALGTDRIPNLNASKINAGTLSTDRIPNLNASKITAGTFSTDRIPNLNASKITAGDITRPISTTGQIYTSAAFYTDGNRSVIRGGSPTLYFRDTDANSAMLHNNSNRLYVLRGGNDTETWTALNGQWPWIWDLTNNNSTCGGSLYCVGNVTAYSDIRHKTDIVKLDDCLEKVEKLNGYTYTRKNDGKRYTGLIAQEVLEVLPEAVSTDEKGEYALAYGNLAGLFVEAMKEMKSRIDALEKN